MFLIFILYKINIIQAKEKKSTVLMLCNYTKYKEWSSNSGDVIYGDPAKSQIIEKLNIITKKKVAIPGIVAKKHGYKESLKNYNIIYPPPGKTFDLTTLLNKVRIKQTPFMKDNPCDINNSSHINSFKQNDKHCFKKSYTNIEYMGFSVYANILTLNISTI